MSKKQHPILFILTVGIFIVIMLFLLYTNIIIFFFILIAVFGWNLDPKFRKRQGIAPQPGDELKKYIAKLDEMMRER